MSLDYSNCRTMFYSGKELVLILTFKFWKEILHILAVTKVVLTFFSKFSELFTNKVDSVFSVVVPYLRRTLSIVYIFLARNSNRVEKT